MENKTLSRAAAMAQFRLAVIAPVIHGLYPDASRNAYYERITGSPFTLPDGRVVRYSPGTISKWVAQYQNGGIEALMPRERADKGGTRVLPDTAKEARQIYKDACARNAVEGRNGNLKRRYGLDLNHVQVGRNRQDRSSPQYSGHECSPPATSMVAALFCISPVCTRFSVSPN